MSLRRTLHHETSDWNDAWTAACRRHPELGLEGDISVVQMRPAREAADLVRLQDRVTRWYGEMAPCWLGIDPPGRRRLVLRTHQWIADSVFVSGVRPADVVDDLGPTGALTVALRALVPADDAGSWHAWIRLVVHDLGRALAAPPFPWSEAWCRWLFLIPYSVPLRATERPEIALRVVPRAARATAAGGD